MNTLHYNFISTGNFKYLRGINKLFTYLFKFIIINLISCNFPICKNNARSLFSVFKIKLKIKAFKAEPLYIRII